MNNKGISLIAIILIILLVLALIFLSTGVCVYLGYKNRQNKLVEEIKKLPPFPEEQVSREIAEDMKMSYPPKPPAKSNSEILKEISLKAKEEIKKRYSSKELTRKKMAAFKKYSSVKPGSKVEFQLKDSSRIISGTYRGKSREGHTTILIKVGEQKYRYSNIAPEHIHLFNDTISRKRIKEKNTEIDKDFKNKKRKLRKKIENKLFKESGYVKNDNNRWIPLVNIFKEKLNEKRRNFDDKRLKDIQKLKDDHCYLGMFDVELPDQTEIEQEDNPPLPENASTPSDEKQ